MIYSTRVLRPLSNNTPSSNIPSAWPQTTTTTILWTLLLICHYSWGLGNTLMLNSCTSALAFHDSIEFNSPLLRFGIRSRGLTPGQSPDSRLFKSVFCLTVWHFWPSTASTVHSHDLSTVDGFCFSPASFGFASSNSQRVARCMVPTGIAIFQRMTTLLCEYFHIAK
jgi:hypothetical protein